MADSMETLKLLRTASVKQQETEHARLEVSRQFDLIAKLQSEKELLSQKLQVLLESPLSHLNEDENPEIAGSRQTLATLKEKISAHRMLGPCGLTVVYENDKMLVVAFTSIWKNLTQTFILKMGLVDGNVKVIGTDIPYFVEVSSLLDNCSVDDMPEKMDIICNRISAYIRRKREVHYIEDEFKGDMSVSYDQSISSIDMKILLPGTDKGEVTVHLWHGSVDDVLPQNVDVTMASKVKSKVKQETLADLRQLFQQLPLSDAFPAAMDRLKRGGTRQRWGSPDGKTIKYMDDGVDGGDEEET